MAVDDEQEETKVAIKFVLMLILVVNSIDTKYAWLSKP